MVRNPLTPTFLFCAAAVAALTGCAESNRSESFSFEEPVERVVIDVDAGSIDVVATEAETTEVEAQLSWKTNREPTLTARYDAGTLFVTGSCGRGVAQCEVDLLLAVPESASVEVTADDASLTINDLGGEIRANLDNGNIEAWNVSSDLAVAEVDNGTIRLQFSDGAQTIDARTDNGTILVVVPSGTYHVDAEADRGDVDVRVDTANGADASIYARTDNGDIDIRDN